MLTFIVLAVIAFFVFRKFITGLYNASVAITKHFEEEEHE
jgi:hypothetical protein